jgi:uncharacterized protein
MAMPGRDHMPAGGRSRLPAGTGMRSEPVYDSGGLEILTEQECHDLLSAASLGRIVFTDRALPAIQPVNFVLHGKDVVIRTAAGSKLAAAARNAVVAFEADDFDASIRSGWSVVIIGHARVIAEDGELTTMRNLPLRAWAPGERDHFITITPEMISGRRLPTDQ